MQASMWCMQLQSNICARICRSPFEASYQVLQYIYVSMVSFAYSLIMSLIHLTSQIQNLFKIPLLYGVVVLKKKSIAAILFLQLTVPPPVQFTGHTCILRKHFEHKFGEQNRIYTYKRYIIKKLLLNRNLMV